MARRHESMLANWACALLPMIDYGGVVFCPADRSIEIDSGHEKQNDERSLGKILSCSLLVSAYDSLLRT